MRAYLVLGNDYKRVKGIHLIHKDISQYQFPLNVILH